MMGTTSTFGTVAEFVAWCSRAPAGTQLDAGEVAEILATMAPEGPSRDTEDQGEGRAPTEPLTWREKLWLVPAETRLGVVEAAEALDRSKSWIYDRTKKSAATPIPHRKLDGTLVFTAGELRAWLRSREEEIVGGPMESTQAERRGLHVV